MLSPIPHSPVVHGEGAIILISTGLLSKCLFFHLKKCIKVHINISFDGNISASQNFVIKIHLINIYVKHTSGARHAYILTWARKRARGFADSCAIFRRIIPLMQQPLQKRKYRHARRCSFRGHCIGNVGMKQACPLILIKYTKLSLIYPLIATNVLCFLKI
uniref:Uncharacterized protein n=1 Tax=Trichogramma kaykai TaxID=54128 RepID=A0ABD2X9S9_9HYME